MRKRAMLVGASACMLMWACLIHAQNNGCYVCENNACSNGNQVGGCICSEIVGGGCYSCGGCIAGHCNQWCAAPTEKGTLRKDMSMSEFLNARVTPEQLAAHRWLEDSGLSAQLGKYSPEMAQLIQSEQSTLKSSFCTNFRRGSRFLNPDDPATEYVWEMIPRLDSDEYRLTRASDGREVRLILGTTEWNLLSGAYSGLLGTGPVATK